jgi:AcrR family transcriptional regulator
MPKVIDLDRLFETVVSVFAERGYDAATTQEMARRAGVNEVTLFRRFGNKAALIEAALGHCLKESPFGKVVASDDARADLLAIVDAYAQTYRGYGGAVLTLVAEMANHPELRTAMAALVPNLRKAADIVAHHQAAGRITPGDPLQKIVLLISPIMVSGIMARSGAKLPVADLELGTIVDTFLDGHGPSPSARSERQRKRGGATRKSKPGR